MKHLLGLFFVLLFISCSSKEKNNISNIQTRSNEQQDFFIGTYTGGEIGSKGIYKGSINNEGKLTNLGLFSESSNPSYIVISTDKKYLLAVNETDTEDKNGNIESFEIREDTLFVISKSKTGGEHPCHLQINSTGEVIVSNYTSGSVGLLKLNSNGSLSSLMSVVKFEGSGPKKDRQEASHAHSAWFMPDGKSVLCADLGSDYIWKLNKTTEGLTLNEENSIKLAPGSGPRHLAIHPNKKYIYSINELNNSVEKIEVLSDGKMEIGENISTLPKDFTAFNKTADIHISKDGKFIYASNRGHNSIAVYKVGVDGELDHIQSISTEGDSPRNFQITPDQKFIIVANQKSNNLVSYSRDTQSGMMNLIDIVNFPTPVCVAFL